MFCDESPRHSPVFQEAQFAQAMTFDDPSVLDEPQSTAVHMPQYLSEINAQTHTKPNRFVVGYKLLALGIVEGVASESRTARIGAAGCLLIAALSSGACDGE